MTENMTDNNAIEPSKMSIQKVSSIGKEYQGIGVYIQTLLLKVWYKVDKQN